MQYTTVTRDFSLAHILVETALVETVAVAASLETDRAVEVLSDESMISKADGTTVERGCFERRREAASAGERRRCEEHRKTSRTSLPVK